MATQKAYNSFCRDLCANFDKPFDLIGKKLDVAFPYLKHLPDSVFPNLIRLAMERWDRWPSNFTKGILTLYLDTASYEAPPITYDPIEDYRFPVGLMQRAFDIILEHGYTRYRAYCDATGMPQHDRDRVEFKAKVYREADKNKHDVSNLTGGIGH